jgi:hypothetical protein
VRRDLRERLSRSPFSFAVLRRPSPISCLGPGNTQTSVFGMDRWVARAARTPSIRQGHEGEVGGPGIRAWAHSSGAGGQRLRSAGALGEGGSVRSQRPGRRAWETASTPVERSEQQTATRTAYARHRLSREPRGKASRRHAFVSNRTGEIPPSGMREGDAGNGL